MPPTLSTFLYGHWLSRPHYKGKIIKLTLTEASWNTSKNFSWDAYIPPLSLIGALSSDTLIPAVLFWSPFWFNSMLLCSRFFLPSFLILLYSCTLLSAPLSSLLFSAVFPLLSKDTQLWLGWTQWLLEVDFIYHCGTNSCPSSLLPWEPLNLQ